MLDPSIAFILLHSDELKGVVFPFMVEQQAETQICFMLSSDKWYRIRDFILCHHRRLEVSQWSIAYVHIGHEVMVGQSGGSNFSKQLAQYLWWQGRHTLASTLLHWHMEHLSWVPHLGVLFWEHGLHCNAIFSTNNAGMHSHIPYHNGHNHAN